MQNSSDDISVNNSSQPPTPPIAPTQPSFDPGSQSKNDPGSLLRELDPGSSNPGSSNNQSSSGTTETVSAKDTSDGVLSLSKHSSEVKESQQPAVSNQSSVISNQQPSTILEADDARESIPASAQDIGVKPKNSSDGVRMHSSEVFGGNDRTRKLPIKPILIISTVLLIFSSFALSFFFSMKSRQPRPTTRASAPTPSIKPPITTPNMPTQVPSSGKFGNFISSPSSSQPTTNDQRSTTNPSPDQLISEPSPQPTIQRPTINDQRSTSPTPVPDRVTFDITAENNSFTPRLLSATQNQVVVMYVTAKDKDYDIAIPDLNLKKIFKKGVKSSLEFQALSYGDFTFRCAQACDNADSAQGTLTVKPQ